MREHQITGRVSQRISKSERTRAKIVPKLEFNHTSFQLAAQLLLLLLLLCSDFLVYPWALSAL